MPPKKKGAAAAKVAKQESLKEPEPETSESEPKKIPKKPFFRYVAFDGLDKVQHIRVKLWKIRFCAFPEYDVRSEDINFDDSFERNSGERLENTLKSLTIKKSLKHVKVLKSHHSFFRRDNFWKQLGSTWRLDSIFLFAEKKFENSDVLKTFLSSSLKNCFLRFNEDEDAIDPRFIAALRIARKCKLMIDSEMNDLFLVINPAKLLPYRKLKLPPRYDDSGCECLSSKIIINAPECFREIYFDCKDAPTGGYNINIELPALPNLEKLHFTWNNRYRDERIDDVSFVKQYPTLQNLGIRLDNREIETLDYIENLPKLKDFSFSSTQSNIRKGPMRSLPNLTQLEKLALHLDVPILTMEHVRDFIFKNNGLRELYLGSTIQNIGAVFEEDEGFSLPEIEKLSLNFIGLERPYAGGAKRIAQVLKTHDSIKEVILQVSQSYADLNAILLKDGVAKMKHLEKLTISWRMSGGLEDNKYKHLKDAFLNNPGLVALDLEMSCDAIATRELGTILDGLMKLRNLKKFRWKAKLVKMTPAAFNKLSSFIVSLRHIKALGIELWGLSEEDEEQLRQKMLPKVLLIDSSLSFSSNVTMHNYETNININEDELDLE